MSGDEARIYLASGSPRRRELLAQIGVRFEVIVPQVDETRLAGEAAGIYAERLARAKAQAVATRVAHCGAPAWPVLAADTVVVVDGRVLGKPAGRADGLAMLRRLAGRRHTVLSGVAVYYDGVVRARTSASEVCFRPLTEAQIEAYWATGEPLDKAGGYAVQGRAAVFIERIEGSYSGVMGLPLFETAALLAEVEAL